LTTRVLVPVIWFLWPFVKLSQGITWLLARGRREMTFSREEFTALAEIGQQEGVFAENESRILKNLFRFGSLRVKDIMTPRIVVFALPEDKKIDEVLDDHDEFRFSRIIVYGENRDDVSGYVLKDEMLLKAAQDQGNLTLKDLTRDLLVVPDALALPALLERLLDRLDHIALVVDEYGGFAGIVSMEDVVETLLGLEVVDEVDTVEDMQELARQQWLKRAKRLGLVSETLEELSPIQEKQQTSAEPVARPKNGEA
jgi:CBS domain containing-hemolysin-like protein